jgi:TolB-like protein
MKKRIIAFIVIFAMLISCGSSPSVSGPDELDLAICDVSDYLSDNIPKESMIVILNMQSDSTVLSEYVIDELIANAVNDKIFKVVDRQQLDLIRTEQNFQLSGEVDDNLALSIGKFFGAQTIVSGRIAQIGDRYRMTIRALEVQTAQVQGQYNRNIMAGKTITDLMRSGGSVKVTQSTSTRTTGSVSSTTARTTGSGGSATGTTGGTAAPIVPTVTEVTISPDSVSVDKGKTQQFTATIAGTNNPDPTVTWTVSDNTSSKTTISEDGLLTVGADESITPLTVAVTSTFDRSKSGKAAVMVPGGIAAININNAATWNTAINRIRNGGSGQTYVINVTGTVSVPMPPDDENLFGSVTGLTVTIQGGGTLTPSVRGSLLRIGAMQTVIVRNVTLRGHPDNERRPVVIIGGGGMIRMEGKASVTGNNGDCGIEIDGGTFIMQDGAISGNVTKDWRSGGGVRVNSGTFTMQGGTITGNTSDGVNEGGGGVYVKGGTFTMQGGTISGNNNRGMNSRGGGVRVDGTFTMEGGTISGNTDRLAGGGVYIRGTFTMQGGIISGNTCNNWGGGGVYVEGGLFTMRGGAIFGNTASGSDSNSGNGGGVCVIIGTFNKTGGTIGGSDTAFGDRNTASRQGHAVYWFGNPNRWRNATAGPDDNTAGYGFWLND